MMGRKLARNVVFLGLLQASTLLLPLVTLPYLARTLGVASFGEMALAQAVVAYVAIVVDYGFNLSAVRTVSGEGMGAEALGRFYASVQGAKAVLLAAALAVLAAAVMAAPQLAAIRLVLICALPAALVSLAMPQWLFQGLERMGVMALCVAAPRLATIPLLFLVVHGPGDAWKAVLASAGMPLLGGLAAHWLLLRDGTLSPRAPESGATWARLREGAMIFLSNAGVSLYSTTNNFVLGLVGGPVALGNFAAADKIRSATQAFIPPVANTFYPHIVARLSRDNANLGRTAGLLLLGLGLAGGAVSLALFLAAQQIVDLVVGAGYGGAAGVLRILSPLPLLLALNTVLGVNVMLPLGMNTRFSGVLLAAGLANLGLLALLARPYGAAGAAVSLVITEALVVAAMAVLVVLDGRVFGRGGARPAARGE